MFSGVSQQPPAPNLTCTVELTSKAAVTFWDPRWLTPGVKVAYLPPVVIMTFPKRPGRLTQFANSLVAIVQEVKRSEQEMLQSIMEQMRPIDEVSGDRQPKSCG